MILPFQNNYYVKCLRDESRSNEDCPIFGGFRILETCYYIFSNKDRKISINSMKKLCELKNLTLIDKSFKHNGAIFNFLLMIKSFHLFKNIDLMKLFRNKNKDIFLNFIELPISIALRKFKNKLTDKMNLLTPRFMPKSYWNVLDKLFNNQKVGLQNVHLLFHYLNFF